MMINREYKSLKIKRTYINGSYKSETEKFLKIQDVENDCENCDWFEFKRMLNTYYEDLIHVIFSWKIITLFLSFSFLFIGLFFFKIKLFFFISLFISIIFFFTSLYLKKRVKKTLKKYEFTMTLVVSEIERKSGLSLNKYLL